METSRPRDAIVVGTVSSCAVAVGAMVVGDPSPGSVVALLATCFVAGLLLALERVDAPLERRTATVGGGLVLAALLLAALWLAL